MKHKKGAMKREENEQRIARLKGIVESMTDIYVGKAKNLKSRVASYFHTEVDRFKTKVLVSKVQDISYTVVNTEEDALLLENNLIKKYNPKYNVLLKDGKTYPSICVTNELLPRIFKTRTINKKWGTYFGPYSHLPSMYAVLDLIKKMYHLRTCKHPITQEGIDQKKYQVCLDYHIHRCAGPCAAHQSTEEYRRNVEEAKEILKGNTRGIIKTLLQRMETLAEQLQFEEAEKVKQQYLLINQFCAKSEVVSHTIDNVDVVGITDDEHTAFINYIHVTAGSINQSFTFEYRKKLNETKEELLALGITEMRQRFGSTSKEIVVPFMPNSTWENIVLTVPQRGDKKTLLELSLMNCKQYRFDRLKQAEKLNPEQKQTRLMKELQEKLQLPKLPYQIECFDNSNISGTDAVAACVVFKALKPAKKHYRKYNIKTVEGPDDYASMKEVVRRRYTRMMEENEPLPNLIITDGGQGQMSVVRSVVEDELHLQIPIAGLAKDNRHRTNELLYGNPPATIAIKTDSELFRILTQIQDEVHRFAITFHRDKRSKHQLHSELDEIKGIGPKTKQLLLGQLKSVKRIQEASIDTLTTIAGKTKAAIIYQHFHPDNSLQTEQ